MHYSIFPSADSWISSGSSQIDGTSFKDQNFGQDQILELKKHFQNNSFQYPTRILVNFAGSNFNNMKDLVDNGTIPSDATYKLKLFEAAGNSDLSDSYKIEAFPVYQSWVEGLGKFNDNPKTTTGCSWENRNNQPGALPITWSVSVAVDKDGDGIEFNEYHSQFSQAGQMFGSVTGSEFLDGGSKNGGVWIKDSAFAASQSFDSVSPDIDMDITNMMNYWLDSTIPNYGIILKFSGSQETSNDIFGRLKYFSKETHTIYAPRVEVQWDGHKPVTGSNTGSLTQLDISGNTDNYIYTIGLQDKYRENDIPKFRIGCRKQYIQKSFTNSYNQVSSSFIPEGSGSYSIVDVATGEKVIDFSDNSKLSCDSTSNYFTEYMNGFYPDRTYKILIKVDYDDGQERIYDNDFEFKLVR